eukprot:Seg1577.4 transcript_id=Seg1577.4/GoldUCD/mRNA.D3Y31 product="hypothetical protein" protein_id=Seg1577.4/GoldUCD/D3Y31
MQSVNYEYDYAEADNTMLHPLILSDLQILLLLPMISLTGYQGNYCDIVEERGSLNWKNSLVFCGLLLCFFFTKSAISIPVAGNPMSPRMHPIVKLICHSLAQGNLRHVHFKDGLPDGHITPREAAELIKEGIPREKYMESPAFMCHEDVECLLEFHLTRLCSARRGSCSLYTVDGKTYALCTDSDALLFVNIDRNTIKKKEGGAIIIRAKGFYQSMALALWPNGTMALWHYDLVSFITNTLSMSLTVYSTRIRINIASNDAQTEMHKVLVHRAKIPPKY